jgi:pyrophosphatase PpaX
MHPLRAALFDIDGTVQDTSEFIFRAFEHVFEHYACTTGTRDALRPLIGLPLQEIYARFLPGVSIDTLRDMHNGFQSLNLNLIGKYDGIEDILKTFKESGLSIAAVSSRKRESLEESLTHSNIIHYFDTIIGPYDTPHHKPHPAPALLALERLGARPDEAIMIGDSYIDIETGKNAGTHTMRVTYGFNQENIDNPMPDYIAHTPQEILQCIKNR